MDIYIGNLPNQINSSDLKKVVNTVLLPTSFRELIFHLLNRKDRVRLRKIDVIENQGDDRPERFACAVVTPDVAARRLLRRMDHLTFHGKSLRVRELARRNQENDRRKNRSHNLYSVTAYDRRRADRRVQEKVANRFS